jgi:excisionase family DNA binding protein
LALRTVTLDARALDELSPATIDRLADRVAARLAQRQAVAEAPLLTVREAAAVAGTHPETVRKAIRSGALPAAGYIGRRPRMRRGDVEAWVAGGRSPAAPVVDRVGRVGRRRPRGRVLGDALRAIGEADAS